MAKYLTRAMMVLADDRPRSKGAIGTALRYSPHTVALVAKEGTSVPGVDDVQLAGRGGHNIDTLFKRAAEAEIPWLAIPRDHATPQQLLAEVLEATGRHSSRHMPGFAVLFANSEEREIRRILAVIDRSEGNLSGLMVLAGVSAAIATGAHLDVLLLGAPGEQIDEDHARASLSVSRAKELFERAQRLAADSPETATWIVVEHVPDRVGIVLDQVRAGDYDLVMDDLGSVKLGGRMGRGGRLKRVLATGGPGETPLALLARTEVPVMLVLDAVQLGLIPPVVVKGGAGAVLALGIAASATPANAASGSFLGGDTTTSISQQVDQTQNELQRILNPAPPPVEGVAAEEAATDGGVVEDAQPVEAQADGEDQAADEKEKDDEKAPSLDEVQDAQKEADKSKEEMKEAEEDLEKAEETVQETEEAIDETVDEAADVNEELAQAEAEYQDAQEHADDLAAKASGVSGVLTGTTQEDVAAAEAEAANAAAALAEVEQEASRTVAEYDTTVEVAQDANEEVSEAAEQAEAAAEEYGEAAQTADEMEEGLEGVRIDPIAEGEYTESAHYGDHGDAWSTGVHTGEDYAAPTGTTVMAAANGTVVYAGYDGAYGNRVVIEHEDGYYTTYNHLSSITVSVGDEVTVGDKIGEVGNTGNSFGSHLHFEVTQGGDGWSSGSFVDPHDWLADSA